MRSLCRWLWPLLLLIALPAAASDGEWLERERELMGTLVSVELWAQDPAAGKRLMEDVLDEFARLDRMMNPWNPASDLARLNREGSAGPVAVPREIREVVGQALYYSGLSDGAFDISFAAAGQHYDYRAEKAPDKAVLRRARQGIDYRGIQLDEDSGTIAYAIPGLQIDLGGIAKGYAVDRAIAMLERAGVRAAVVAAGGDSRILGDLGDRPRTVGIRHPRKPGEYAALIPLADTAISTSGDYERFFLRDGVRYHHILDPDTGRSAKGVQSATVLAPGTIDSDALSTTIFVLGVERGLALVNRLPGVDAIVIDSEGKLHYSEELLRADSQ